MNTSSPRKPVKTFTIEQVAAALAANGIAFKVEGRQVTADLSASGHMHVKISPAKGLYLDAATGKGGTIAALLHQVGASSAPLDASLDLHPRARHAEHVGSRTVEP
mgnify:CR=1 FL=1